MVVNIKATGCSFDFAERQNILYSVKKSVIFLII
ncbi:unknown [Tannerella sp. CAG:118]|uniref:Uncharacterized protein n=1 Tax=Coprobacter secundus subsp. similis TaxID=2751153 RepID=A0A7G1HZH0_9BACT|nr:hypothetical protein Cop2CBH44_12600 [Coprobacter secundus subsp. similis]CCY38057.1 unknown [Tannerella sp. CAG:118]